LNSRCNRGAQHGSGFPLEFIPLAGSETTIRQPARRSPTLWTLRRENGEHSRFLFLSERSKAPLSIDGVQKLIERLGDAARLPFPSHAHMLRHSAGYALAGRGVDTTTLQAFMGHRSIANTVIYTAVADKRLRHIWDR
jgi:site-specific recombinase XerD